MTRKTLGACAAFALALSLAAGETVTVDNVTDLTNHLDRLNREGTAAGRKNLGHTVILKKGVYDVSACHMLCDPAGTSPYSCSTSHLALAYLTFKGETDDPRDTVIYGDRSERILYLFEARIRDLTVSNGCTRTTDPYGGGGLLSRNEGGLASNIVVTCCKSNKEGGGIKGGLKCMDCDVEYCESVGDGGGVSVATAGFFGGRIRFNRAGGGGGGVVNAYLNGTLVEGNVAAQQGGGYKWDYKTGVTNCVIIGNTAASGGGASGTSLTYCSLFSNNVAVTGGGIACAGAVRGCRIVHNLARALTASDNPRGGGCYGSADSACRIYDSIVAGNAVKRELPDGTLSTHDCSGGAGERVYFTNCEIYDNYAKVGASLNWGWAVNCRIFNNVSIRGEYDIRGTSFLRDCAVSNQTFVSPGPLTNCRITDYVGCWELPDGANVYTSGTFRTDYSGDRRLFVNHMTTELCLTNCLIANNAIGNILVKPRNNSTVHVVNCTIASNRCSSLFAQFTVNTGSHVSFENSVICHNHSYYSPYGSRNFWPEYGSSAEVNVSVSNCLIGPGWLDGQVLESCTGLIDSDNPWFSEARDQAHPFSLRRGSPARGKAAVADWMADAYDIRGDADGGKYRRLRDGACDLGCYQCWLDPVGTLLFLK